MAAHDETPDPADFDPADFDAVMAAGAALPALAAARDLAGLSRILIRLDQAVNGYYFFDDERRLGPVLSMGSGDVTELIGLIGREVRAGTARPGYLLHGLSETLPDEVVPLVCADWLAGMDRQGHAGYGHEMTRMARAFVASGTPLSPGVIATIRRTVTTPYYGKTTPPDPGDLELIAFAATLPADPVLNPGEAWADAALADAAERGPAWRDLLAHAVTATSAKPSGRWEKTARERLAGVGEPEAAERIRAWLALVPRPRTFPLDDWHDDLLDIYNANAVRGLAWMLGLAAADADSARALADLAVAMLRKLPGTGQLSPKVANAAVCALSLMPGENALAQLGRLVTRITYRGTLTQLDKALEARAAQLGVPREQIEEMAVPGFGLTEVGRRTEQLGGVTAEIVIQGRIVDLIWRDATGKTVRSVPAAARDNFADEVKELKTATADIEKMLPAQAARLDRLFLARRTWDFARWSEYYLNHPLVGTLARRLIWVVGGVPAAYADGALRTRDGLPLEPAPDTRVELWHPIGRDTGEIVAWRDWLDEHQVTQPFKQAHREVYRLTAAEEGTGTYSNRFAAHILRQHQFNALAARRGWRSPLRLEVDDSFPPATRDLPEWGLRAEYWVQGTGPETAADDWDGAGYRFRFVATDQVRFYPAGSAGHVAHAFHGGYEPDGRGTLRDPVPLASIPPLLLSEVLRDVDLFTGVASIGNDPEWQDHGPLPEADEVRAVCVAAGQVDYDAYWRASGFGELSEIARTRADVLARLLPRLAIGPQCTIQGRFLHIRGTLHEYKIHLGSGNILMSPDDSYLCIVPDGRTLGRDAGVTLPFEGDDTLGIIISKALLLARDDEITEPSIASQIRGQ